MLIRPALALLFGLMASIAAVAIAFAATSVDMGDFNATFDQNKNMHLVASVTITAPPDKVFDAIAHPEITAKNDPQVDKVQVVGHQGGSEIVELFGGQQVPIPNAPNSIKIKVTPDKANNSIEVDSYQSPILQFQNSYKVSPTSDGKGSIVAYTSTSNDISKQIQMEIPSDMRKTVGLQTFMMQMQRVAQFIDSNSGKVATK
ncbi:MAG TPA: SRPBCC family protein [Candidatus Binataceae bacterium]|nr:SRPBCC family protein [Candidatus Binataceae bacterium]